MTGALENKDSAGFSGAWSLLAGGAACLAASPYIALRMMPPGVLLLCAVLPAIASSRVAALGVLLFAARIWMLAITASVWDTPAFGVAAPLLCIGLLLDMPAAARRAAAEKKGVPVAAAGAIIAALLMGIGLALLALLSPGNMPPHWAALLFFMAGAFCTSLIPPPGIEGGSGAAHKSAVARAGAAALLAATLGCMAHVGAWLWAAEQSLARERAGDIESAMAWARLETARAGRLKFEGGVTRGLKRQALLAGACGRIEERLALNNAILRRDPNLVAPRAMAVSDALALDQLLRQRLEAGDIESGGHRLRVGADVGAVGQRLGRWRQRTGGQCRGLRGRGQGHRQQQGQRTAGCRADSQWSDCRWPARPDSPVFHGFDACKLPLRPILAPDFACAQTRRR